MWWMMVTFSMFVGVALADDEVLACEDARMKCLFRDGCNLALRNYMVGCSSVLQDQNPTHCPEICLHSLIALTSTIEGQALMNCTCSDDFCLDAKRRVEICRPNVTLANKDGTIVSCLIAEFICAADNECSTALYYYKRHCKSMFHGRKCTHRCSNAISILKRQEKATKLENCKCDGREDYDCTKIQKNMATLCFKDRRKQPHIIHPPTTSTTTSVRTPPHRQQPPVKHSPQKPVVTTLDVINENEAETNYIEKYDEKSSCSGSDSAIKSSVCLLIILSIIMNT